MDSERRRRGSEGSGAPGAASGPVVPGAAEVAPTDGNGTSDAPAADNPPESASRARPRRSWFRRWLRRFLVACGGLLLVLAGLGLFRHAIIASAIPRYIAPIIANELGMPVAIESAALHTEADGSLVVELRRVTLAADVPGATSGRPDEPTAGPTPLVPVERATIDRVRIHLDGWLAAREGLSAVREIEISSVRARFTSDGPSDPSDVAPGELPSIDVLLPPEIPRSPFPVHVVRFEIARGSMSVAGSLHTLEDEGIEGGVRLRLDDVAGIAGFERGEVLWSPGGTGTPRFRIDAEPIGLHSEGWLERGGDHWRVRVPELSGNGFVARIDGVIPYAAPPGPGTEDVDDAAPAGVVTATLRLDLEVWDSARIEQDLGLTQPSGIPTLETIGLDITASGGDVSFAGLLTTTTGALDVQGALEERALREGNGARARTIALEVNGESLPAGSILTPWLAELRPIATGDITAYLDWSPGRVFEVGGSIDLVDGSIVPFGGDEPGASERPIVFRRFATLGRWRYGGPVELEAAVLSLPLGRIVIDGTVPVDGSATLDAGVVVKDVRLEEIGPELPGLSGLRGLAGQVDVRGRLTGTLANPVPELHGELTRGEIAPAGWERIREIDAVFRLEGLEIALERVDARLGGGVVRGEGGLTLSPSGTIEHYHTEVRFESVRLLRTANLRARAAGTLRLLGDSEAPFLSGELRIVRGIYDRDLYPSLRGGGSTLPFDLFRFEEGFLRDLAFDVELDLAGNFEIRNNRVRVAPYGTLRLEGTGYQPVLTGAITATEGKLILPQTTFDIARVEVRFPEEDPFNPRVEFIGSTIKRGVEIDARATGPLFAPELTLSSSPAYPEEDLILLVATGRFRDQIGAEDVGVLAATELARLYGPQVWGNLFGGGGEEADSFLERVEIGARSAEDTGEFDGVTLEVRLNDWISVFAEQDVKGESTADLRFYWWFP